MSDESATVDATALASPGLAMRVIELKAKRMVNFSYITTVAILERGATSSVSGPRPVFLHCRCQRRYQSHPPGHPIPMKRSDMDLSLRGHGRRKHAPMGPPAQQHS